MFTLLMEPYAMIQLSILLQSHRIVVANFVPGNFGLFRQNAWQPLAELRLQNTALRCLQDLTTTYCLPKLNKRTVPNKTGGEFVQESDHANEFQTLLL